MLWATNLSFYVGTLLFLGSENFLATFSNGWANVPPDNLVSISPIFYGQLLRQNPFAKKLQTQIVST
jgi:hypothetical protein